MKKLLSKDDVIEYNITLEQFLEQSKTLNSISTESASNFLYSIKDILVNGAKSVTDKTGENELYEALSDKFKVLNIVKNMNTSELKEEVVLTPEKFKGKYVDYLKNINGATEHLHMETVKLLDTIKMAIAGFVNEYKPGNSMVLYGVDYAIRFDKRRETSIKEISKYFPHSKAVAKSRAVDVIKSVKDMDEIYNGITTLASNINRVKLNEIDKLAREVSEMVDKLIEQNQDSALLMKNENVKKELVNMLYIGAKAVEFCGYTYTNSLYMFASVKSLSDAIVRVDARK